MYYKIHQIWVRPICFCTFVSTDSYSSLFFFFSSSVVIQKGEKEREEKEMIRYIYIDRQRQITPYTKQWHTSNDSHAICRARDIERQSHHTTNSAQYHKDKSRRGSPR